MQFTSLYSSSPPVACGRPGDSDAVVLIRVLDGLLCGICVASYAYAAQAQASYVVIGCSYLFLLSVVDYHDAVDAPAACGICVSGAR